MKPLTIKDIARLAQVSVTTVSRVLNDEKWVSEKTRLKVQQVINENNFTPSMIARGMISQKINTLSVIVSDIMNPYFTSLVQQIEKSCLQAGYSLSLYDTQTANRQNDNSVDLEISIFQSLIKNKVDGVIILGGHIDYIHISPNYIDALNTLTEHCPVIVVGQKIAHCRCSFLLRDQVSSTTCITKHLLAANYQSIGFIGGSPNVYMTEQRLQTFKDLTAHQKNNPVILNNFYIVDGYNAVKNLISSTKQLPDALLAINDQVALGIIRALLDDGLRVPQDVAVASCEYFYGSEFASPRLTTVNNDNSILGAKIVDTMLELLIDNTQIIIDLHADVTLISGESC